MPYSSSGSSEIRSAATTAKTIPIILVVEGMIPIKIIMVLGIFLMILQTISTFFKDLAKAKGITIS